MSGYPAIALRVDVDERIESGIADDSHRGRQNVPIGGRGTVGSERCSLRCEHRVGSVRLGRLDGGGKDERPSREAACPRRVSTFLHAGPHRRAQVLKVACDVIGDRRGRLQQSDRRVSDRADRKVVGVGQGGDSPGSRSHPIPPSSGRCQPLPTPAASGTAPGPCDFRRSRPTPLMPRPTLARPSASHRRTGSSTQIRSRDCSSSQTWRTAVKG